MDSIFRSAPNRGPEAKRGRFNPPVRFVCHALMLLTLLILSTAPGAKRTWGDSPDTGVLTVFAGGGVIGSTPSEENVPATSIPLAQPRGLALDTTGNLYVSAGGRIRKISAAGRIRSIAGQTSGDPKIGDGGPATEALFVDVHGLMVTPEGDIYMADRGNHRIRHILPNGTIETVAGTGTLGSPSPENRTDLGGYSGDGGAALSARLNAPMAVARDAAGALYIADTDNHRIRKISPNGIISTIAGIGPVEVPGVEPPPNTSDYSGDGGLATQARLNFPADLLVTSGGELYIADTENHRVRKVDTQGVITTLVGNGQNGFSGDGGPATAASLSRPHGLSLDATGALFIADTGNHRVRKVTPDGVITTVAGKGPASADANGVPFGSSSGDGGTALKAGLNAPEDVVVDPSGTLYIADTEGHRVRKVSKSGYITTVGGDGHPTWFGDGLPARQAGLGGVRDIKVDGLGNVYIAEGEQNLIRKVLPDGTISTVAGNGVMLRPAGGAVTGAFSGDGGPALLASLNDPEGIAVDAKGNLYIADTFNDRVRQVDANGIIRTIAGGGSELNDGRKATQAKIVSPTDVELDAAGNLYIADSGQRRVRKVTPEGVITTVMGNGSFSAPSGPYGDGELATEASLSGVEGIFVDNRGRLLIAEMAPSRVRRVELDGTLKTVAGTGELGYGGDGGPARNALLKYPMDICVDVEGNLYIADSGNRRIRRVRALDGVIETVAGNGESGTALDGVRAMAATLMFPQGLAVDPTGNLLFADIDRALKVSSLAKAGLLAGGPFPLTALPPLAGDDNSDRQVNVADAVYSLQIAVGLRLPVPQNDVARDRQHDIRDTVAILKSVVYGTPLRYR